MGDSGDKGPRLGARLGGLLGGPAVDGDRPLGYDGCRTCENIGERERPVVDPGASSSLPSGTYDSASRDLVGGCTEVVEEGPARAACECGLGGGVAPRAAPLEPGDVVCARDGARDGGGGGAAGGAAVSPA